MQMIIGSVLALVVVGAIFALLGKGFEKVFPPEEGM